MKPGYRAAWLSLLLILISTPAFADDDSLSGAWDVAVDLGTGAGGHAIFELDQDGATLHGHYSGQLGTAEVSGSVNGNDFAFSYTVDVDGRGEDVTVSYSGHRNGTQVDGTCEYGSARGTFTGSRETE